MFHVYPPWGYTPGHFGIAAKKWGYTPGGLYTRWGYTPMFTVIKQKNDQKLSSSIICFQTCVIVWCEREFEIRNTKIQAHKSSLMLNPLTTKQSTSFSVSIWPKKLSMDWCESSNSDLFRLESQSDQVALSLLCVRANG